MSRLEYGSNGSSKKEGLFKDKNQNSEKPAPMDTKWHNGTSRLLTYFTGQARFYWVNKRMLTMEAETDTVESVLRRRHKTGQQKHEGGSGYLLLALHSSPLKAPQPDVLASCLDLALN